MSHTGEPTYTINWRVHFDDNSLIAEYALMKHKRLLTDAEWQQVQNGEHEALDHCAGLLKQEFDLIVNPSDTTPDWDGGLQGTCQATKDAIFYIFSHEDMDMCADYYEKWYFETSQTIIPSCVKWTQLGDPPGTGAATAAPFPGPLGHSFRAE